MKYFLCLGSNDGDRAQNLESALARMEENEIRIVLISSLYETEPVGLPGKSWFLNQVVEVESDLSPEDLLHLIKGIEKIMGRDLIRKLSTRVIDIDILFAEDIVVHTNELQIPHPRLEKRNFVLVPLAEIAPGLVHPVLNEKMSDLLIKSEDLSRVKIISKFG